MEEVLIYLLKSSGLMAAFFLSYHLLLRKETFFTSNRWFLLAGLITSVLLPLFFIKKIIFVEKPKVSVDDLAMLTNEMSSGTTTVTPIIEDPINWIYIAAVGYVVVVLFLILKVLFNILSLFRLLHNKKIKKQERYAFVDVKENIAPFSFFNFIVFNSSLYTQNEMESILLHEKVHSSQNHSIDVLIAKLFTVLFWFNPFVWFYKKAIIQNLEYIADNKAVQLIEDKRVYQKALLKVVTHQNCLSLTNQFYQSLIKKRIVMLNKNQSHKRNSWKYAVIIPALIAFIIVFQVKVIAQEIATNKIESIGNTDAVYITTNKNSTDAEMKKSATLLKEKYGVKLKFSKVKRNASGEITGIKIEFKDREGNSGATQYDGKDPIKPIHFYKTDNKIGFGKSNRYNVIVHNGNDSENFTTLLEANKDMEAPEVAEYPEAPEAPETPEAEEAEEKELFGMGSNCNSKVYFQKGGEEPIVIVNGEIMKGGEKLSEKELKKILKQSAEYSFSMGNNNIAINYADAIRIQNDAMNNARISMKKMRPEIMAQAKREMERAQLQMQRMRPEMERARIEMEKARPSIEKAREDIERSLPEIEKAKAEMMQARNEMLKAKAEMEQAKAELEKTKAELKNKN